MPGDDERKPPRRLQSQTERDNEAWRRQQQRKTSLGGERIPTLLEDELTPAPITLDEATLNQLEQVDAIREIRAANNANARAIAHEQRARKEGKEIGEIEAKVAALAGVAQSVIQVGTVLNETVLPAVRELTKDMRLVLESRAVDAQLREQTAATTERLQRELGALNGRLAEVVSRIEATAAKTNTDVALLAQRLDNLATSTGDKVRVIEADLRTATARITELESKERVATALTTREKFQLGGVVTAIASVIAAVAAHFTGG